MKNFVLFLILLLGTVVAHAQLVVKPGSFKEVPGFVNVNPDKNYQFDDNDLPFAIIKVRTENINDKQRRDLKFSGNAGTFIVLEYNDGEVWVYLTAKYADYLKISHPDFSSTEFTLPYDLKAKHGYELTLENKTVTSAGSGSITIVTKPEADATVSFNGKIMEQKTPYHNGMIAAGSYEVKVSKERYKTVTQMVEILDDDSKTIEIDMPIDVATITVKADNMTDVCVDGKLMARGTWSGELYSGNHEISLSKDRYKTIVKNIVVEGGENQTVDIPMSLDVAVITLKADSQTDVYVDGNLMKRGTWKGEMKSGQHEIEYRKENHRSDFKTITVVADNQGTYELTPTPLLGTLSVASEPSGATVFIDGKEYGNTPLTLDDLIIGSHELRIEKNDKKTFKKVFVLEESSPLAIEKTLEECPTGAIVGVFSVDKDKKVYFSKGNLQYQPSTKTWRFAANQWECHDWRKENEAHSKNSDLWMEHFSWGTSGYKGKDPLWHPKKAADYGDKNNDIANTNYDWGVYNTISNGGDNKWRTPTAMEWTYLLLKRQTKSGINFAWAKVNGIKGFIILPDNWDNKYYNLVDPNSKRSDYEKNQVALADWNDAFETNGAVFLPLEYDDAYWTSSFVLYEDDRQGFSTSFATSMFFFQFGTHWENRPMRKYVRLVCDVEE